MNRKKILSQLLLEKTHWNSLNAGGNALTIPIRIGSVRLDLITSSLFVKNTLTRYFSDFTDTSPTTAHLMIEPWTHPDYPAIWEDPDPEFQIQGSSVIHRDFAAKQFQLQETGKIPTAWGWINPEEPYDAIHNLLRWFLPKLLLAEDSFLIHGAGVVSQGRGYAFFGQSGAGKSTCTQMIAESDPQVTLVGDDAIIVQYEAQTNQAWLYSAPLGNGYSRLAPPLIRAPLCGFYSLHQDQEHFIENLSPTAGIQTLLASSMAVQFSENAFERIELSRNLFFSRCGIQRLHFQKNAQFWTHIKQGARHDEKSSGESQEA